MELMHKMLRGGELLLVPDLFQKLHLQCRIVNIAGKIQDMNL